MKDAVSVELVARSAAEALERHDIEALVRLYSENAALHDPLYPEPVRGREGIRKHAEDGIKAFPDLHIRILKAVPTSGLVAAEWKLTGTNTGALRGPSGETRPATRRRIEVTGASTWRVDDDGFITEEWRYYDVGSLVRQLGITEGA